MTAQPPDGVQALSTVHRACPLCGRDNAGSGKIAPHVPWNLTQCPACRFVYLETTPAYEHLTEDIGWEESWAREHERRREAEPLLHAAQQGLHRVFKRDKLTRMIHRLLPRGNVLDVGCGNGHRSDRVATPTTFFGIEIERSVIEEANRRFGRHGGRVICAPAIEGLAHFEDHFFDGAILRAYLEHEMNPASVLKAMRPKLKPNAPVIVKVPNVGCWNRRLRGAKWCGYRFPEHVNYFTPETLRRIMESCGYRVAEFGLKDRFPLSDNMWMVAQASGPAPSTPQDGQSAG